VSKHDPESGDGLSRTISTRSRIGAFFAAPAVALGSHVPGSDDIAAEERGPGDEDLDLPAFNSGIQILDNGKASPYATAVRVPSEIKGVITDVNLILKGFRHDRPSDVAILLSHENRAIVAMRGAGAEFAISDGNILLDDNATDPVPESTPIRGGIPYKPADYREDLGEFGGGAPAATASPPVFSEFNGQRAEGDWVLYVRDNRGAVDGRLEGWQLVIVTDDLEGPEIVLNKYRTREDRTLSVGVNSGLLARDDARPESSFRVEVSDGPKRGKLKLESDGSFTYKPSKRKGTDSFTYTIIDSYGGAVDGTGLVEIDIVPRRRRPWHEL
jgi:hypothetical protein